MACLSGGESCRWTVLELVSKSRVGEIFGLEVSSILDDLLSFGLIYCDPSE
jgi:hypothetical protein